MPSVAETFQSAVRQHRAGRLSEAEALYRRVLQAAPDHADALHLMGLAAAQQGRYPAALELIGKAIRLNDAVPDFHNNLAEAYRALGRIDEALAAYRRAIALAPGFVGAHLNLGGVLCERGLWDQAEACYRNAIAAEPDLAPAHYNLGDVLKTRGRLDEAVASLKRAAELAPDMAIAHNNLGATLQLLGRLDQAIDSFRRAIAVNPDLATAQHNLGVALTDKGRIEEAVMRFRKAIALAPDLAMAHWHLGMCLFDTEGAEAAAAAFAEAIRHDGKLALAHCYQAMVLDLMGRRDDAAVGFGRATKLAPELEHTVRGFRYARAQAPAAPLFGLSTSTLAHALAAATGDGLYLEFGVYRGKSITFLAGLTRRTLHGFDSFIGIPDDWTDDSPRGAYDAGGELPRVPANVRLHQGWFADSLPRFLEDHPGPARFLNVDCDLYDSTRTIFSHLGPRIQPGTVIIFDEYLAYEGWQRHEYKAFQEFVRDSPHTYEYIGFNIFGRQAVVRIVARA
ncbi:MAG: tetratricopeptide repeat protein [Kiloniellales bacterium]